MVTPWPTVTLHKVHSARQALFRDRYNLHNTEYYNHFKTFWPAAPGRPGGLQSPANYPRILKTIDGTPSVAGQQSG